MDNFVETYRQPNVNQEEINNLKRLITKSKIQPVIKNVLKNSVQDWVVSRTTSANIHTRMYTDSVKLLEKTQEEGTLSETIYEAPSP